MKVNQRVRYGVACLLELSKHANEYLDAFRISESQKIPAAYAQKILQSLAHAGLVFSQKGIGYRLSRSLEYITVVEVIEAVNKTIDADEPSGLGSNIEKGLKNALERFTLDQLVA